MNAHSSFIEFKNISKIKRRLTHLCILLSINSQWITSSRKKNPSIFISMLYSIWPILLRNKLLRNRKFSLWPIWALLSWLLLTSITSQSLWNSLCWNLWENQNIDGFMRCSSFSIKETSKPMIKSLIMLLNET